MALILGVSRGSVIYLDHNILTVVKAVRGSNTLTVSLDGGPEFVLDDQQATLVLNSVLLSVGKGKPSDRDATPVQRIAIDAPRNVRILRSELYEREYGQA